jgi:type VI secretion system secreted protein Hcp
MAFDTFLKVEGVDGESTDEKHPKWIEIISFSHGFNQPPSATVSSSGGASSGRVNMQDFSVVKRFDSASTKLYEACCTGKHFPTVKVEFCRADGTSKMKYMEIKMSQVMVSSVRPGGTSGDDVPLEEVAFNFGKIEWTYIPQDRKTGAGQGNIAAGWDLQLNKKI